MRSREDLQEYLRQLKMKLAELILEDTLDSLILRKELLIEISTLESQLSNYINPPERYPNSYDR